MSPEANNTAGELRCLLERAAQMQRGRRRWSLLLRGATVWLATLLGLLIVDAAFVLPAGVRAAGLIALLSAAGWVVWRAWRVASGAVEAGELSRLAGELEAAGDVQPGTIQTALELAQGGHAGHATPQSRGVPAPDRALSPTPASTPAPWSDALIQRAVERAREAGERAIAAMHAAPSGLARQGGWLWAVVVVWAVVGLMHPGLVGGGLARLALPGGGHGPYALSELAVHVEPETVQQGGDALVRARVTGRAAEQAWLVELDDAGQRWPMQAAGPGRFDRRLRQLDAPLSVRVEAGRAVSAPITINPQPPEVPEAPQTPAPPENRTPDDAQEAIASDPPEHDESDPSNADETQTPDERLLRAAFALMDDIEQLARDAAALAEANEAGQLDEQQAQEQAGVLAERLERLQGQWNDLQAMAGDMQPGEQWQALMQAMDASVLMAMPAGEDAQALPGWAAELAEAGLADVERLRGSLGRAMRNGTGSGEGTGHDAGAGEISDEQLASGLYYQRLMGQGREQELAEAVGRVVPRAYREPVQRYWAELHEDSQNE